MPAGTNVVVHIVLPKGIALTDGSVLQEDVTFDFVGTLTPYYASIDQVRLAGGMYIRKLSDFTLASQIYQSSQEADLMCPQPLTPANTSVTYLRFAGSRNQWVSAKAAKDLILNTVGLLGAPGSHTLSNFSIVRSKGDVNDGIGARLKELNESLTLYDPTLRSHGVIMPGGRPKSQMSAKGVMDWTERTPSRTWLNTGIGANALSMDFGSATGGRGKPVRFFSQPFNSPPITNLRTGAHGTYPLIVVATAFPYQNV